METLKNENEDQFEVWEENWQALEMFLRLATQWQFSDGAYLGLNYQSVEFLFRIFKVKNQRQVLQDLQIMELAALRELNKKG